MTIEHENIPELSIELMAAKQGRLILLEQDSGGNIDRVAIHLSQLRYMAEKFGLIETSDPQALKTIAALKRRLLVLRDRVEHLANFLAIHSDSEHADLSYEQTYATATADIADQFCVELVDTPSHATATAQALEAKPLLHPTAKQAVSQAALI
jgi:hypothetical protein